MNVSLTSSFKNLCLLASMLVVAALAGSSCDRPPPTDSQVPPDENAAVALSPAEVVQKLGALHRAGDYPAIAEWMIPKQRESAIQLLRAIDEVLTANRFLRDLAERHYRGPAAETWNLAAMENNLGIFSRDVALFGQEFKGDQAVVTLQEGCNVPLVHATFEWHDGRWLYRPEATPKALVKELKILASILWDLCDKVNAGVDVNAFADGFVLRVLPQIRRAVNAADQPSHLASAPPSEP